MLLSPSVFEGFGIPPIEAIHLKTPFLIAANDAHKEVWGNDGYYHTPWDVDDLRYRLKELLRSKTLSSEIVERCSERAKAFTPRAFAKRFDETLKKLMGNI